MIKFVFAFVASFFSIELIKLLLVGRLRQWAKKTKSSWDDLLLEIIDRWDKKIIALISLMAAARIVSLAGSLTQFIQQTTMVGIGIYVGLSFHKVVDYVFTKYSLQKKENNTSFDPTILEFLRQVLKLIFWLVMILLILQNLGLEVSALVGGLGIGGLAVAFAIQNILSDIFSSISIYFDKPFGIGDYIQIGTDSGTVKKIGIKSTRLQTPRGEELIISNKELTQARVQNFKKLRSRRVSFTFYVEDKTTASKLENIPQLISSVLKGMEKVELVRVHLVDLGHTGPKFEVIYNFGSKDFGEYRDAHQTIMLKLLKTFEKEKIKIAHPVRSKDLV